MATSTVEDYLKCIYLEEQRSPGLVGSGRIASALAVTPGTATAMVKTLAESGLVRYEPYSGVALTDAGRKLAVRVLRRHRLVELFLVQIMGIDWTEVHDEAEALEHVVSERLVARMDEMLGFPAVDPHGDPIPNAEGVVPKAEHQDLLSCELGVVFRVARVRDQSSAFLRLVERQGLMPGCRMTVEERDAAAETVELQLLPAGERVSLGFGAASKIFVEAVPAGLQQEESPEPVIRH